MGDEIKIYDFKTVDKTLKSFPPPYKYMAGISPFANLPASLIVPDFGTSISLVSLE